MRDLNKYTRECIEELKNIDIYHGKILSLEVNTRAKKRWGSCTAKLENGKIIGYKISINKILLDEQYPEKALKNTIIHELLHSCGDCLTHKNKWKELAEKVNEELGYDIQRINSKDFEGIPIVVENKEPRYVIKCQNCGSIYTRKRRSKLIKNPEKYLCGKCNGKLELIR